MLAFAITSTWRPPEVAAQGDPRVVIQDFRGPSGSRLRKELVKSFRKSRKADVLSQRRLERTSRRQGHDLSRPDHYVDAARDLQLNAYVTGQVERRRGRYRLQLQVRDAYTGVVEYKRTITDRRLSRLRKRVRKNGHQWLRRAIERCDRPGPSEEMQALENEAPPPVVLSQNDVVEARRAALDEELFGARDEEKPPSLAGTREPAPAEDTALDGALAMNVDDESAEPELLGVDGERKDPFLEVGAGMRLFTRGYTYSQNVDLRPDYNLPFGPAVAVEGVVFPGALLTDGHLARLGVDFGVRTSFGLQSQGANVSYPTNDTAWSAGAQYRLPLKELLNADATAVFQVGYGNHAFTVESVSPADPPPPIASVAYSHVRVGAAVRTQIASLGLDVGLGYRGVVDAGDVVRLFPGTSVNGLDFHTDVSYPLLDGLDVVAGLDGQFYFLNLAPENQVQDVVASATDYNLGLRLMARYTY